MRNKRNFSRTNCKNNDMKKRDFLKNIDEKKVIRRGEEHEAHKNKTRSWMLRVGPCLS